MNARLNAPLVTLLASITLLSWSLVTSRLASAQSKPPAVTLTQQADDEDPAPDRLAPTMLDSSQKCLDCHGELIESGKAHGPVEAGLCTACHEQLGLLSHDFRPFRNIAATCAECHQADIGATIHEPVQKGECMTCHDPHSSENAGLLLEPTEVALCGRCHEEQLGLGKDFVHGPVALGVCTLCHDPHAGSQTGLLRSPRAKLCFDCHTDFGERLVSAEVVHAPVAEDCSLCHDPHASEHRFQLREEGSSLCLECHLDIRQRVDDAVVSHSVVTTEAECLNCHQPHHASFPKLLDQSPIRVCMECHQEQALRADGSQVMAIGRKLDESEFLHGPIREGNCTACHEPHGSQEFALLRNAYPQTFYAPYATDTYALCTQCHDVGAFEVAETETLTGFRDGSRNLHFVHVNKDPKGRTCRSCHDTHASNMPRHIIDAVPFGKWNFPIGYEKNAGGGTCSSGCHQERSYTR